MFFRSCVVCGANRSPVCERCYAQLRPGPPRDAPPGFASCRAALLYDGPAREVVARVKYRNGRVVIDWLGAAIALLIPEEVVVISWIPTTMQRIRARGFDHAQWLADAVGRHSGRPVVELLRRTDRHVQTGSSRLERRLGPTFTRVDSPSGPVALIDDVWTTGSTLRNAAAALRPTNFSVHGRVAAYTQNRKVA